MADTATFSAAMKTKFIGPIRDNMWKGKVLLFGDPDANPEQFKGILASAENIDFVGNEFRIPIKAKRNQAVGFRSENEVLPAPGSSEYTYLTEPMRYAYGLFNITGQLMKAAETNEGAFRTAFKAEMEDTVLTSKLDFNRAAFGDASGKMATCRTTTTTNTTIPIDTTINLRGGEIVDWCQADGTVIAAALEVASVDRTNRTVTFTAATGATITVTTDFLVRSSRDSTTSVPNNSQNKEINGLSGLIGATGTVHGLNSVTYSWWKSYVSTTGGAVSDSVLRDAKDAVGFESGMDVESGLDFALITTRGIRRRYADTLTALKRFTNAESVKLHGGFTALMFDENPIFTDDQCPVGYIYGLALNKFFWAQLADWDWMNEDGSILKWDTTRRDRYIAVLYKYCQLGTTARNAHFKLSGHTDDVR
jgi:hypothetical protein